MGFSTVSAYVIAIIVAVVLLLIAAVISNLIAYQPGNNPTDPRARRIWFWVFGIFTPIISLALSYFIQYTNLRIPTQKSEYLTAMCIAACVGFVLYIILGFVLSRIFKNGKLGNWF